MTQDNSIERLAEQLAESWGFPPSEYPDVLAMARLSSRLRGDKTGKIVAALGLANEDEIEALLASKPSNVLTLEYLSGRLQGVRTEAQKLLATIHGHVYFDEIDPSLVHPLQIENENVKRRCDELNAILLKTPLNKALLVFSDYSILTAYSQEGRLERLNDPIRRELPSVGVGLGDPGQIIRATRQGSQDGGKRILATSAIDNFWAGTSAKTDAERVLARLLESAIESRCTDIAIEPQRDGTAKVRFRRFGDMVKPEWHGSLDVDTNKEICRFLISRSRAGDGGRLRNPAGGQITYKSSSSEVFIRCDFIPADRAGLDHDMISVDLRLLPKVTRPIYLEELGLPALSIKEMRNALMLSQGMIIVSGPTNSGKSTTIAGAVGEHHKLFGDSKKRLSLEDPVERYLEGITQITVDNNFAELMRHILRHDPDLVWIGELRDGYSATSCVRAATSGHIVLSTVHANDAVLTFRAISNYLRKQAAEAEGAGASIFDLAESLSLIVAQRLVKTVCRAEGCWSLQKPSEEERLALISYMKKEGLEAHLPRVEALLERGVPVAKGCPVCGGTGAAGEVPIQELLPVTRAVKDLLGKSEEGYLYSDVAKFRTNTLFESALDRVEAGDVPLSGLFI